METVAVIGSNCFTGSHFVSTLLDEPETRVVGISRSPESDDLYLPYAGHPDREERFSFHRYDLVRDAAELQAFLSEMKPDYVINVAALSQVGLSNHRPVEYMQTNVVGVVTLIDFLRRQDWLRRYVHISSAEIYGPCSGSIKEDAPFYPSTPYAVSKAASDMYLATLGKNFDFDFVTVRSTNVYGPHQQLFKIVPRAAIYIHQGKIIELHGGGTSVKSFVHVRDVVQGGLDAMRRGSPGVYHFSTDNNLTIAQVVGLVAGQMGRRLEDVSSIVGERLGQDSRYRLDCTRAREELGWEPRTPFEAGVKEVVDWVAQNIDRIQTEPLEYQHVV